MNDLEKYELVNQCETKEELAEAILKLADEEGNIIGRAKKFDANKMASRVEGVIKGELLANALTRCFGIRQQALYISYYERLNS